MGRRIVVRRVTARVRDGSAAVTEELLTVGSAHGAERVALRAGLTVLLSLGTLAAIGHFPWALYASFGAFASIYGGRMPAAGRWRTQVAVGVLFTLCVGVGALVGVSPERELVGVPVTAVVSALVAMLASSRGWVPPGALFPVFAVSACSSVPGTAVTVGTALVVSAAAATIAVVLGVVEERLFPPPAGVATAGPPPVTGRPLLDEGLRNLVAVGLAGTVATVLAIGHPYWAMVAAVAPMTGALVRHRVVRGVNRAVGTVVGLLPAALLLWLPLPIWALVIVVAALQAAVELLIGRHYGLALIFITPLALLVGHAAHPTPVGDLLADRGIETALGALIGIVVAVVMPGRAARVARRG